MKKAFLLSFLILIFSCSNDNDDNFVSSEEASDFKSFTLSISQSDGTSLSSCPEVGPLSFLIKDNSLISGAIGKYGQLEVSSDNSIFIYSCTFSSTGNNNFIIQRFGGTLTTINGESVNLEGRVGINRETHQVNGSININTINSDDSKTYNVIGEIHESGSCEIQSYPR